MRAGGCIGLYRPVWCRLRIEGRMKVKRVFVYICVGGLHLTPLPHWMSHQTAKGKGQKDKGSFWYPAALINSNIWTFISWLSPAYMMLFRIPFPPCHPAYASLSPPCCACVSFVHPSPSPPLILHTLAPTLHSSVPLLPLSHIPTLSLSHKHTHLHPPFTSPVTFSFCPPPPTLLTAALVSVAHLVQKGRHVREGASTWDGL